MKRIEIIGIEGIPEVRPGDDLGDLIIRAVRAEGLEFLPGDVLVVTQKVVSKAEGRLVDIAEVEPSPFAVEASGMLGKDPRVLEVILREAARVVRMDHGVLITETKHGFICANSGVDASNVSASGRLLLLPEDPDAAAARIRSTIKTAAGIDVAVIISDSFGRPWREGIVNVAVGVSGMSPILDYRGQFDSYGVPLRVTQMAIADEMASASELATGKVDGIPVVLLRGAPYPKGEGSVRELLREPGKDLFR